MKWLLIPMFICALMAQAADISGTWKGTAETPAGTVQRTFVFKVAGSKLTGETSSDRFGKSAIEDGKVDGANISFTIAVSFQGEEAKVNYKGKVNGEEIKFTVEVPGQDQTIEYIAKRVP
jgi:hypothetical protein